MLTLSSYPPCSMLPHPALTQTLSRLAMRPGDFSGQGNLCAEILSGARLFLKDSVQGGHSGPSAQLRRLLLLPGPFQGSLTHMGSWRGPWVGTPPLCSREHLGTPLSWLSWHPPAPTSQPGWTLAWLEVPGPAVPARWSPAMESSAARGQPAYGQMGPGSPPGSLGVAFSQGPLDQAPTSRPCPAEKSPWNQSQSVWVSQ